MLKITTGLTVASLLLIALGSFFVPHPAVAAEAVPNVTTEMLSPDFWTSKLPDPDRLIMDTAEIEAFNRDILRAQPDVVYDLTNYPASLDGTQLTKLVTRRPFPDEDRYSGGLKVDSSYYESLRSQMNLPGIMDKNEVFFALTVQRTSIRTFPTADESLSEPDDHDFDLFQETAVGPAEPVLLLHRSLDGEWYYVQTYNYNGWIPAGDVAVAGDRQTWLDFVQPVTFLVVTGNRLKLDNGPDPGLVLTMGTKVPLENNGTVTGQAYTIELPARGAQGELEFKTALVPVSADVSVGYLPYTRANIIQQAFKILGERYGWGGLFKGRDCSAFVMDVYKSFGLMLPRNGDEQEQSAGQTVQFEGQDTNQRYALLDTLLPGASLHTPTHELLYLGQHEGRYYVIHDVTSVGDPTNPNADGLPGILTLNRVVVSDLTLPRKNGQQFINALTSGKQLETKKETAEPGINYNVSVYVNDSPVAFPDQKPYLDESVSRVLVPVRFISEALGAGVKWQAEEQKVILQKGDQQVILTIGSKTYSVGGQIHLLDAPAIIMNSRTMVPLRFVSEALGAGVTWTQGDDGGRVDIR
ncbi:MAG: stalk domain-containing protein [Desulfotomaculaceae bacterium]|nr:stalk domain-containing protein [Desulfotomaculaceae bacterium]